MKFSLNGVEREYNGDPKRSLLRYLRDEAGITSAKDGCSPQAACGCCAVEVGGKIVLSCVFPMKRVQGKAVVTTEGLNSFVRDALADAFVQKGGVQCGFCTPGMVMRGKGILDANPKPTRAEIARGLDNHLCRCTGYTKIVDAIETAGEAIRTKTPVMIPPREGRAGTPLPKHEARPSVLGNRPFIADMNLPDQLHGALRYADHPRARVLSIDISAAEALEGVERIFLADDVPGERQVGLIVPDWPLMVREGELTRYIGDVLALVVAHTREIANEAVKRIEVEYERLEPVTDVFRALEPDSPNVHERGNIVGKSHAKKGDARAALVGCDFISEGSYQTQMIEHAFLEPEASLARPTEDGVMVYSQGQGIYEDRRQIASLLGLSEAQVAVVLVPNGGAFGGKEDLSVQGHAALASLLLQRPVKIELSREESMRMHPKRHPITMRYKLGCDREGKLKALLAWIVGDTGAYASVGTKVLERAAGHSTGAYHIPHVDVTATTVYTNNLPCGAMRGFGANQAIFALESCIDDLCAQGGFDRWQFRYDNALVEGSSTATGEVLKGGVGVRKTLEAVEEDFRKARYAGIACGLKNTGIGNGMPDIGRAKVVVKSPEKVVVHHGWTDMGQGCHTIAVQVLCEETGITPDRVEVMADTREETPCGMTTASRATSLIGNAVIDACKAFKRDLAEQPLEALVGREYRGEWICDWTTKPGEDGGREIVTHYSYSYATQVVILDAEGRLEEVVAAHDAGKIMNPLLFEGQIEGSIHMGLGYALSEELVMKDGYLETKRFRHCGVLRAKEMPRVKVIGVEVPDPHGPYGAKGVGEIGLVPTAPAVAGALRAFDGRPRTVLPMKEDWARMKAGMRGGKG